uniref:Uncharacterized protein n=1 Tax=Rhizophora mucronata TaxID=61149 RepID=A0A2P2NM22_RHIMU
MAFLAFSVFLDSFVESGEVWPGKPYFFQREGCMGK